MGKFTAMLLGVGVVSIKKKFICSALVLTVLTSEIASAGVVTTTPGDNEPLPPGTDLALLYFQHAERDRMNVNGRSVVPDFRLTSDIALARFVHWTTLGGFVVTPQVILPFGRLDMRGTGSQTVSGMGDPIFGSNIWLYSNKESERYFSLGGYFAIPAGSYDAAKASMNLGENRWKGVFEVNWVQAIISRVLYGEVTLEVDKFGDNNNYAGARLRQNNVYELQTHLRYIVNDKNQLGVSYFHTIGGETYLNGMAQNDRQTSDRALLTWTHFLEPRLQLQFQGGTDLYVKNGPQENWRFNFRIARAF